MLLVLLTLLEDEKIPGFFNACGESYLSRRLIGDVLKADTLTSDDVCYLFTSFQLIHEENGYSAHTHGMEQFALPDIQMNFEKLEKYSSIRIIMIHVALTMMEEGQALKPGTTFEIRGEGIIYDIKSVSKDKDFPDHFGKYGAIEFSERKEDR